VHYASRLLLTAQINSDDDDDDKVLALLLTIL